MRSILDKFDFDAKFRKRDSVDPEMLTPIKSGEIDIKVHKYGKTEYIRSGDSFQCVNVQCYLIPEKTVSENNIEVADLLDGQPIKSINMYTIPSGRARKKQKVIYEVLVF